MQNLYPAKPSNVSRSAISLGTAFKREIIKVFFLCLLFLLLYLLLLTAVVGIAILFGILGYLLVSEIHSFPTLMLGLGAAGMGIMLIYFMLSALVFKKSEPVITAGEVTSESEPAFYNFISKVCKEAGVARPKRIFLVDGVNAFVGYDSVFLSLFFPTGKNLYIGLALINTSTISELKAVIAHEFGHFSQGSMRLGSYIYHFNQMMYKMVADNSGYNISLEKFAGLSRYFALFAGINLKIIKGIQDLMGDFYKVLNKGYMGLSRQMEFHADAVAASVAGSAPLISSLYRMDLAAASYEQVLSYYNGLIKENYRADNLYTHHFKLMQMMAVRGHTEIKNGFPMVHAGTIDLLGRSHVIVKDQWASHPPVEDREAALLKLNIATETVDDPAWILFNDAAAVQARNTERIYSGISFSSEPVFLSAGEFELKYGGVIASYSFQPGYGGYYDHRHITAFDVTNPDHYLPDDLPSEKLFSDDYLLIPKTIKRIETDLTILESISAEGSGYKSFDFEGVRYPIEDVSSVKSYLTEEHGRLQESLKVHDQEIFYSAKRNAAAKGGAEDLENAFIQMFEQMERTGKGIRLYNEMAEEVAPVYTRLSKDEIEILVLKIIHKEKELKKQIEEVLSNQNIASTESFKEELTVMREFYDSTHVYFTAGKYLNNQLDLLQRASNAFLNISTEYYFQVKKSALEIQAELLGFSHQHRFMQSKNPFQVSPV